MLPTIRRSGVFAVNILAEDQAELCRSFARRLSAQFAGVTATRRVTGAPVLGDALAYLDCTVISEHQGGDHVIVVGEVVDVGVLRAGGPLTFFRSRHPRLEPLA